MTDKTDEARILADAGIGRQLRDYIIKSNHLHDWSGEIRSPDDLETLNKICVLWDIWKVKGIVTGDISDHPVLGKVIRSIRSRNVNDSIQKSASELGLFTSLIGPEDYSLSMSGIDGLGSGKGLYDFFMREMDVSACIIHIRGRMGTGKTDMALLLVQLRAAHKKIIISSNMESFDLQDAHIINLSGLKSWLAKNPGVEKWFIFDEASTEYNSKKFKGKGNLAFSALMRKVRKVGGKLIIIGHRENDIDKDARDLASLEIEKPYRNDPKFAVIHVDGRKILVRDIPATKFPFDTNDLGEFDFEG